jgi:outer membrane receptor protein involved in Fe transport
LEVAITKRLSNRWQILGSVARLWKNLPVGGAEFTPIDPNSNVFAENKTPAWYAKLGGSYQLPWDIRASASFNAVNGEPYRRTVLLGGGQTITSITLPVEPWGSRHQPNAFIVDARVEKVVRLVGGHKVTGRIDVFNLTNTNVSTSVTSQSGASFGLPTSIMPPRIAVFSLSYTF